MLLDIRFRHAKILTGIWILLGIDSILEATCHA